MLEFKGEKIFFSRKRKEEEFGGKIKDNSRGDTSKSAGKLRNIAELTVDL
jgi:hypothetical protein